MISGGIWYYLDNKWIRRKVLDMGQVDMVMGSDGISQITWSQKNRRMPKQWPSWIWSHNSSRQPNGKRTNKSRISYWNQLSFPASNLSSDQAPFLRWSSNMIWWCHICYLFRNLPITSHLYYHYFKRSEMNIIPGNWTQWPHWFKRSRSWHLCSLD